MHITMGLPTFLPHTRTEELAWYRKIDEGPWDGLATWDRVLYPGGWSLVPQLAAAAAMTERVRLWTCIAIPTLRNEVLFAKDIATIDLLSDGRVTLGVGIGYYDADYLAVKSELPLKRQRLDSQVSAMRRAWAQEPPVAGDHPVGPRPVQDIPLMAGVRGPKALARAAQWADGVTDPNNTTSMDAQDLISQRERVAQAWTDAGRVERPHFSACAWFALGPDAEQQLAEHLLDFSGEHAGESDVAPDSAITGGAGNVPHHGPAGLRHIVDSARAAGLDDVILIPTTADPSEIDRARDVLGI